MAIQIKSNHYVIKTDHFYSPEPIEGTVYIEVNNSRIEQVSFEPPTSNTELLDLTNFVVGPGFIDVHIHGFAGHDTMEGTLEAISSMAEKLASTGTTAFLPTTTGAPVETLKPIMDLSNSFAQIKGAKPLGLHLEGPFISKKVPGAMDPNLFRQANKDDIMELLSEGKALMVTMAPEIEGHLDMIELFAGYGVSVSLGHTSTDYETAAKAFAKGATSITHYFNAMSPFQHRQPGLIGAGLLYPFYLQFIADGVHTHIATIKIMCQYVKDRLVLITDATMAAGLGKPGTYTLGNRKIIVDETSARLENGTLAGSVLTMDRGFRNLICVGGLSVSEAFTCASLLPAKSIGLTDRGTVKKGAMADIVVLHTETLQVEATIREGNLIYARADQQ